MAFSNRERDIFIIKLPEMIDRGALMSRYSRASNLDIRDVYRKEFEGKREKGSDFYKRIFLDYGDESIAELTTEQIGIQNVSNIASKIIEEVRVGLSYLEKSTRYVRYDKKIDGKYLYMDPEQIGIYGKTADDYVDLCNDLFDFYSSSYDEIKSSIEHQYPVDDFYFETGDGMKLYSDLEEQDRQMAIKSYNSATRSRTLDELRLVLPASTLTNLGISGNGRSFIHLIQKLYEYDLPETRKIAESLYNELRPELPELIDESTSLRGNELIDYKKSIMNMRPYENYGKITEDVSIIWYERENDALDRVLSLIQYPFGEDAVSIKKSIENISYQEKVDMIKKIAEMRKNRRMKLWRPFESVAYTLEINTNYGAFRDMQRHRFLSIIRKPLNTNYGYDIPEFISKSEKLKEEYCSLMDDAQTLYQDSKRQYGAYIAQYAVPMSFKYPVAVTSNLSELTYFIELRSTPQAHPDMRLVAIKAYEAIRKIHPLLSTLIKFVDIDSYPLGRLSAEMHNERKKNAMGSDSGK
ncbi:MAG: FAD-dependent thymidylate synthase [Thermoplasmata archaeon]